MATLPRTSKPSTVTSDAYLTRRQSEFDAGINTSNAWTQHLERESLSDEEPDSDNTDDENRPARALYDFEGKVEFRELSVQAGDEIDVVKEELADGWSLVKNEAGEVGLLPRTYYTVCNRLHTILSTH
jgi:sorting nexin-9/18/33